MKIKNDIELLVVYTGEAWEVVILRNLLINAGIKTWLLDEKSELIGQTRHLPSAWKIVTIKVSSTDFDCAKLLVADYEKNAQEEKFKFEL